MCGSNASVYGMCDEDEDENETSTTTATTAANKEKREENEQLQLKMKILKNKLDQQKKVSSKWFHNSIQQSIRYIPRRWLFRNTTDYISSDCIYKLSMVYPLEHVYVLGCFCC